MVAFSPQCRILVGVRHRVNDTERIPDRVSFGQIPLEEPAGQQVHFRGLETEVMDAQATGSGVRMCFVFVREGLEEVDTGERPGLRQLHRVVDAVALVDRAEVVEQGDHRFGVEGGLRILRRGRDRQHGEEGGDEEVGEGFGEGHDGLRSGRTCARVGR